MRTLFALFAITMLLCGCNEYEIISTSNMPPKITTYINTYFPESNVSSAFMKRESIIKRRYKIYLDNGFELKFDRKLDITEIDGNTSPLPISVIPNKIANHIKSNFQNNFIVEWEKEGNRQKIEMDNGIELEYNSNNEFIKFDY